MDNDFETLAIGNSTTANGFSLWDLMLNADWIVQTVILVLLFASFWSWSVIIAKVIKMKTLKQRATNFEESFWSGSPLDHLYNQLGSRPTDPFSAVFSSAMREWQRSSSRNGKKRHVEMATSLNQRIERVMKVTMDREMDDLDKHMSFLASIGSTAPFVGLFGTVWGIMNSFQGIAMSQSTNLAVVAPGIAEALFATALGLVVAIPAVLAYNRLSTSLNHYYCRLQTFSSEFSAIISRQLDESEPTAA